jgi:hypothetical protein
MNSYLVQIRDAVVEKFIVLSASIFSGMTARPAGVWDSSRDIFLKSASETVKETIRYQDHFSGIYSTRLLSERIKRVGPACNLKDDFYICISLINPGIKLLHKSG